MGALSHLSMYNSAHLHVMCFRTARSKSSWSMLSNRPLMSNSKTQSYFQHPPAVAPTGPRPIFFGLETKRVGKKIGVKNRLNPLLNTLRPPATAQGGPTKTPSPATLFRNGDGTHRRWK